MKSLFSAAYFSGLLKATKTNLSPKVVAVLLNNSDAKKVNLDKSKGLLEGAATNFYDKGITAKEVDEF